MGNALRYRSAGWTDVILPGVPLPLILCRFIPFKIPFDRRTILHSILHGTRKPLGHNGYAHTSTYYFTHFQKLNFFLIVKLYNIQIV